MPVFANNPATSTSAMNTPAPELSLLTERLAELERRCARARRLAAGSLLVALALPTLAFLPQSAQSTPRNDVIQAHGYEVVNADGKVRARLALDASGSPELRMFDSRDRARIRVGIHKDSEPLITLIDEQDKNRLSMVYSGDPHFVLSQPGGKPTVHMTTASTGAASLLFTHVDGHHNAGIGIHADGRGFLIQETPPAKGK